MAKTYILLIAAVLVLLAPMRAGAVTSPVFKEIIHPPVNASDGRTPLYFSLIQSFSGQYISAYSLVGLELALDIINDDPTLLPGYSLHYVFTDAPVSPNLFLIFRVHVVRVYQNVVIATPSHVHVCTLAGVYTTRD